MNDERLPRRGPGLSDEDWIEYMRLCMKYRLTPKEKKRMARLVWFSSVSEIPR